MCEKLPVLFICICQFGAGILLLIQFFETEAGFDMSDSDTDDYIAFESVYLSVFLTMLNILYIYHTVARD